MNVEHAIVFAETYHAIPETDMFISLKALSAPLLLFTLLFGFQPVFAQTARVQFIHASPYAEVAVVDVYRNGELWLDDFAFAQGTPFEDWPAGRTRLDFTWAEAPDASSPFFSETRMFRSGEHYYVIAAGDPLNKPGQPSFELFVRDKAREVAETVFFADWIDFIAQPDVTHTRIYIRRWDDPDTGTEKYGLYGDGHYGYWTPYYIPLPPWSVEVDVRDEDKRILDSVISDVSGLGGTPVIHVGLGFMNPPRPGDARLFTRWFLPDGTVLEDARDIARVQFIHNAPYLEADTVDVYVTRLDSLSGDPIVKHLDNLSFREATAFIELPAGLVPAGEDATAPYLVIDVTAHDAPDNEQPFYSETVRLLFDETYVAVLTGDPLQREGQPAMRLSVFEGWTQHTTRPDTTDFLFAHGTPDLMAANLGEEGEAMPLAGYVSFGTFAPLGPRPVADDTLFIANADTRRIEARFPLVQSEFGTGNSALVLLTSGFLDPPTGVATANSDFALLAAGPSGGPLFELTKWGPPPLWTQPWVYIVGLFVLAVVALTGNQVRVLRLRKRERELNVLVDERTKELVAEKKKTEEQARRLVELDEAKNRFFANISHEFRTPLTLILGPIQDAIDGTYGRFEPRFEKQLGTLRRNARRLLRLINQLLDLSRLESGRMELHLQTADLVGFTRDLTHSFVPLAERRRIDLSFEAAPETLIFDFDADAMEKAVSNLISNALKFTPEDGKVLVMMETCERDGVPCVEVAVRDNGPGIAKQELARIFDRFQQVDTSIRRKFEGSGIGLTLAKELVELHGGTIRVESEVDFGSTFTLRIPCISFSGEKEITWAPLDTAAGRTEDEVLITDGEAKPVETATSQAETDHFSIFGKPKILIVEDNADVRAYLRGHLEADYYLLEAEDGQAGLEAAREHEPNLILSDVMMPRMDGYEMCRLIKANDRLRSIPVVMLTAKAGERDTIEGLSSGADDYLAKPFSINELKARMGNLIVSRREMREKYSREVVVQPSGITIQAEEEVFLERVVEVVNEHLGNSNFGVDWLAEEVGLSRRQLERRVEAVVGETPAELIRRLRLERASQLLRARAGTVSEVGYAVGFNSASHFSRVFREAYGESPSAYMHSTPVSGEL